jgi:hypothetical protein
MGFNDGQMEKAARCWVGGRCLRRCGPTFVIGTSSSTALLDNTQFFVAPTIPPFPCRMIKPTDPPISKSNLFLFDR